MNGGALAGQILGVDLFYTIKDSKLQTGKNKGKKHDGKIMDDRRRSIAQMAQRIDPTLHGRGDSAGGRRINKLRQKMAEIAGTGGRL